MEKLEAYLPVCGIYMITCIPNNREYIGCSKNIVNRLNMHAKNLLKNKHSNKGLQEDFNKYGAVAFKVELLQACTIDERLGLENILITKYYADGHDLYNQIIPKHELNVKQILGQLMGEWSSRDRKRKIGQLLAKKVGRANPFTTGYLDNIITGRQECSPDGEMHKALEIINEELISTILDQL